MDAAKSATEADSPAAGAAQRSEDTALHGGKTAAADRHGDQRRRSASTSSAAEGKELAFGKDEPTLWKEHGSAKAERTPLSIAKADTPPDFSFRPPPLVCSFAYSGSGPLGAPTYETSPDAAVGSETLAGATASGEAHGCSGDESDEFTFASQLSYSPVGAASPRYSTLSPAAYPSYFADGDSRIAVAGPHLAKTAATENVSSFLRSHGERLQACSTPSNGRGGDDIIEFVVRRPTSRGGVLPYFLTRKGGLSIPPLGDSRFHQPALVDKEGNVRVAAELMRGEDDFQQGLRDPEDEQRQLLHAKQRDTYVSAHPGTCVPVPYPKWEGQGSSDSGSPGKDMLPTYPFYPNRAAAPAPVYPEPRQLFYPVRPPQTADTAYIKGGPSLEPQAFPVEAWWSLRKQGTPFVADNVAVAQTRHREPWPSLLPHPFTLRKTEKGPRVVVPKADRYICFGHAGDEIKLCFGLLQVPPPTLRYDFVLKRRPVYCGMCENVDYVAVCRKCRMRLPTCAFCHKQSAIRHP